MYTFAIHFGLQSQTSPISFFLTSAECVRLFPFTPLLLAGHEVSQLVEELRYVPEGRVFDRNYFTDIIPAALRPWG
jgi:hypothetical protein